MPMSSSAVINRADVLAQIDALEAALPQAFAESDKVFSERDALVAGARWNRPTGSSSRPRTSTSGWSPTPRSTGSPSTRPTRSAAASSASARRCASETDEYVDGRLANLEITLTKTLEAVTRGRDRLHGPLRARPARRRLR